ncbi:hypothetical protein D4764_14G0001730 [Takifugu flavidus]|uniref:Uncharacterized protein n=1 Tax=Takifugu flavidus TaxID=433684 RepID=A0A5C6P346_9TELE|nr:hypothetical protein D4764_14G0001730 [Takifugu flavidus]
MQSRGEDAALLEDTGWTLDLAFLTDITGKRNSLNWELQGKDQVFPKKCSNCLQRPPGFRGTTVPATERRLRLNISSLARLGRGPENAPESHIVFA